ncbi:MAG: hypothetical protein KA956_11240 [Pyrinomonadaceae bacterium]|nr:hypothetical protein [Pyrinomonadaceae bacterium]
MTTRKNQNSILVLATLGVYLGLVLVGATPQILAQAAMTKQFNVKDEIEVNDDLDKKPDDCEKLAAKLREKQQRHPVSETTFYSYSSAFSELTSALSQLKSPPFSLTGNAFGDVGLPTSVAVYVDNARPRLISGKAKHKLETSLLALSRLFPAASADGRERFQFALSLDDKGLVSTVRILRQNDAEAHQAFIAYDSLADLWRCIPKSTSDALVSKNTQISWENNQVIVITRLPRAGLDSLLAANAK